MIFWLDLIHEKRSVLIAPTLTTKPAPDRGCGQLCGQSYGRSQTVVFGAVYVSRCSERLGRAAAVDRDFCEPNGSV
jgi:hypothetical protein